MSEKAFDIAEWISRSLDSTINTEEQQRLRKWIEADPANAIFFEKVTETGHVADELKKFAVLSLLPVDKALSHYFPQIPSVPVARIHFLQTVWFRWAAAIIILFGIGTYIFTHTSQPDREVAIDQPSPKSNDVLPGYSRAVLTLSDGQRVELDSAASETINDGNLSIKNNNGQLSYTNSERGSLSPAGGSPRETGEGGFSLNTMSTPRGGQYQLTLSDGTKVWLNAASSITYPTAFKGASREISMTGEAYFEVAQNSRQPFIINAPNKQIRVLGTSFNANAYPDEQFSKISLMDGSIKIGNHVLMPGQALTNGKIINTDIQQDIAWKNGAFNFTNVELAIAMRQIERWYDVQVMFAGKIPVLELKGKLPREFTLKQVLAAFADYGLKYKLVGKKLIISP